MLSRTAENLYWLARYVERAEYIARTIDATLRVTALHVVQDDGDDRRPACEKGADDRRNAKDTGEQAEGMKCVDNLGPGHQRIDVAFRLIHQQPFWSG